MAENVSVPDVPSTIGDAGEDEISLLDLAIVLAKHKKRVLGLPALAAVLSVLYALSLTNIYTASTKIVPPMQSQSTASALLSQLGGAGGVLAGAAGIKTPSDLYVGMMKSRTLADAMIQRFNLNEYYGQKLQSGTRNALEGSTTISVGKDGFIIVAVDDKDPKFAAELANAYIDELQKLMRVLAVTEASQRRLFFENQLKLARENLSQAENAAKQAIESGGLTNVEAQGRSVLETTARLRGQISVKEVQIGAMRAFAAERNPDLMKAQQELASMRNELTKIEGTTGAGDAIARKGRGFQNLKLLRDVKYYETIMELLAKQYEMAKIDEAKDMGVLQVLDKAIEPDRKSKPKRAQMVLLSTLAGMFVGILWAFVAEAMGKAQANPESAQRMAAFRKYLRFKQGYSAKQTNLE